MPKLPKGMVKKRNTYFLRVRRTVDGRQKETPLSLGNDYETAMIRYRRLKRRAEEYEGQPTFGEFAKRWLTEHCGANRNEKGRKLAEQRVRDFIGPRWESMIVGEITTADITGLAAELRGRGLSSLSVRHVLADVSCIFSFALDARLIDRSPFTRKCWPTVQEEIPDPLSDVELRAVLEVARSRPKAWAVLQLGLWTGIRYSELRGLAWPRVDLEGASVTISRSGHAEHTKNRKARRIPLLPEALAVVGALPQSTSSPWIFTGRSGGQIAKEASWISRPIVLAVPGFHFHRLRHTFASNLLRAGVSMPVIQKLLGHASIRTTERYARLFDGFVDRAVRELPAGWMPSLEVIEGGKGNERGTLGERPGPGLAAASAK